MARAIDTVREWLKRKRRERDARKGQEMYRELQKYGTLRKDRRIVNRITH